MRDVKLRYKVTRRGSRQPKYLLTKSQVRGMLATLNQFKTNNIEKDETPEFEVVFDIYKVIMEKE